MTRVATWRNEDSLLNVAFHGTAAHVETQVRLYRQVKRIEALEQGEVQHARSFNIFRNNPLPMALLPL